VPAPANTHITPDWTGASISVILRAGDVHVVARDGKLEDFRSIERQPTNCALAGRTLLATHAGTGKRSQASSSGLGIAVGISRAAISLGNKTADVTAEAVYATQ
jgi:hypothetical protein